MKIIRNMKIKRINGPRLPLFMYLAYLLMISLIFSSVSLAKYVSYSSASAAARVAYFNVAASAISTDNLVLDITEEGADAASYSFTVTNSSEVLVSDKVTVWLPSALPEGVEMTMTVNGKVMVPAIEGLVYIYTEPLNFDDSHTWVLTFSCSNEAELTEEVTLNGISIKVDAEQIDY